MPDIDYKQLCADMLEAWEIACCPVIPSDPDVVFNRARLALGRDLASCIGTWPGDETDSELLHSLKEIR